ncbi:unnamed protein product [Chrysoparadoxa australica]
MAESDVLGIQALVQDEHDVAFAANAEERLAWEMAHQSALKNDVTPISKLELMCQAGPCNVSGNYEHHNFLPAQRSEAMSAINLGIQFERISANAADVEEPPMVLTAITVVECPVGTEPDVPAGYEVLPIDMATAGQVNPFGDDPAEEPPAVPEAKEEEQPKEGDEGEQEQPKGEKEEGGAEAGEEEAMAPAADSGEPDKEEASKAEQSGVHAYLCVKLEPYTDEVEPLVDLAVVYGNEGFKMGYGFETLKLPASVTQSFGCPIFICTKGSNNSIQMTEELADRAAQASEKQVREMLRVQDSPEKSENLVSIDMTQEEVAEWEERREDEIEMRNLQREKEEDERRKRQASKEMTARLLAAEEEHERLSKEMEEWQKRITVVLAAQQKKRQEGRGGSHTVDKDLMSQHETEKHYAETLNSIMEAREQLTVQQAGYDKVAIGLQTLLDQKEYRAREIAESLREFKREIARSAENTRTGKHIPTHTINQFEAAEARKDEEIEKVRLKNINLRMTLKKFQHQLRAKEQLAEGLHLIDFEQLKIENQTLNEKIEERNDELHKLQKKSTSTVQVLTHTKEKLQFVAAENEGVQKHLVDLESKLALERDKLTKAKKEKEAIRDQVAALKTQQGFANSALLVEDFDGLRGDKKRITGLMEEMRTRREVLREEQLKLSRTISMSQDFATVPAPVPRIPGSGKKLSNTMA